MDQTTHHEKKNFKKTTISSDKKEEVILESVKAHKVTERVDRIISWINNQERKLAENKDHKAFLILDLDYNDIIKNTSVDAVLRLLGTRLLTNQERADPARSLSIGLQATTRPNIYIYYEHRRPQEESLIWEKYGLFVAKNMKLKLLDQLQAEKIAELPDDNAKLAPGESPKISVPLKNPTLTEIKAKDHPPGIFETINKVLLGRDEEV